jgi:hypothetical protein
MIRSVALRTHRIATWALVAGIGAQLAMTTFGVFVVAGSRGYLLHATFGRLLAVLPLLVLLTALVGRVDRRGLALIGVLVGLVAAQVGLVVLAHEGISAAMALHPINGGAIFVVAGYLASRADGYVVPRADVAQGAPLGIDGRAPAGA